MRKVLARRALPLAALIFVVGIAAGPSIASAENPLYCNGEYNLNGGCSEGPRGLTHLNETKNESGGCIANTFWTINNGYLPASEICGQELTEELTHKEESFPRCWNRSNAKDLIHCRYSEYSLAATAPQTDETLPAEYQKHLTEPGTDESEFELEPEKAKLVEAGGVKGWEIPGRKGLCLHVTAANGAQAATACESLAGASAKGIVLVERGSSGAEIYGLVSTGDSVTVTNQNGTTTTVSVSGQFFAYSSRTGAAVVVHAPDGETAQVMPIG